MRKTTFVSRHQWLKKAVVIASAVVVSPFMESSKALATTSPKIAKAVVHYQDHPLDGKMCGMCQHFIPLGGVAGHGMMGSGMMGNMGPGMMKDGTCQLVQGQIRPMGYCILYAPVRS